MNTRLAIVVLAIVVVILTLIIARSPVQKQPVDGTVYNGTSFSIRLPAGYRAEDAGNITDVNLTYKSFIIPASVATGTNLSTDTSIRVMEEEQTSKCTASEFFLPIKVNDTTMVDGDTTYSVASTTGAAAGNRYEETVYALPGTNPCIAVQYFIHYGVIENYPPGVVKEFDRNSLIAQFDAIRRTLTVAP